MLEIVSDTISHHLAQAAAQTPEETAFTFVDFSTDRDGVPSTLTWCQLEKRVRTLATALRHAGAAGERVAIVAPQNLDYVVGFLAATCAGAIAVPLFPPTLPGHAEKLAAALADADPVLALSSPDSLQAAEKFLADQDGLRLRAVTEQELLSGRAPGDVPAGGETFHPRPEDCAYLQYTSGSTRVPSGVEITHANVCANARQALEAYDIRTGRNCTVGWLPLYHDMGLVLAIVLPIVGRVPSVLMEPLAFVQQPVRWLRLLTQYPGALTAAPNFAFDYCARRVTDEERGALSLGSVAAMVNGSEPVAEQTLQRFQQAFAHVGMVRTAMRPSYGLAEATVFVSASPAGKEPTVTCFDRDALADGTARVVEATGTRAVTRLVGCGQPTGQEIAIVDPATHVRLEDGHVGEIWLRGPNVGRGYFRRPEQSEATFRATLHGDHAHHWLRTGDLALRHDEQLYITGRIKDLVIIDGTNHYPQDIEQTVESAHPAVRRHHTAAFSVLTDDGERLVVVAEHVRDLADPQRVLDEATRAVRAAVSAGHAIAVHDFVLAQPGTVPHTTSGKVARGACRERYLQGVWSSATRGQTAGASA
ncbi:acyl-CoA synthetase (AMP-forming)/AMP-acid ligase II [Streptomyces africanus]|uniref:Acyl-CoA synthetase (AMP-forming)/AMP-acid ligase II n=1 Tax=Streptomyces africanus TaxID=231024 RepID=A0ABU0QN36_9ACTN|nr:fatty acyl-AMP ligase [Streptomyces africanus]MDQ0748560.1 acyl-CoA synthetase (AMP-forming)/AMP-acid ligase II [Streptomyces africanus]